MEWIRIEADRTAGICRISLTGKDQERELKAAAVEIEPHMIKIEADGQVYEAREIYINAKTAQEMKDGDKKPDSWRR